MRTKHLRHIAAAACLLIACPASAQQADAFPSRPLRMKTQLQFWGPIIKRVGVTAG